MFKDAPPALELRGLTKRYDDGTLALENFDLEIPAGSFFGLLGPNGAGKTTLISAVCNLIRVTSGDVLVFGEPADTLLARSWIGLAEQDINCRVGKLIEALEATQPVLQSAYFDSLADPTLN